MVKNVSSQRGKISPTSLHKMALVSAKIKIRFEILREWPQIINIKSQKISNPCCKPFLKYSRMFIGVESTVHPEDRVKVTSYNIVKVPSILSLYFHDCETAFTHFTLKFHFYTPLKKFSDVFRGYNGTLG